MHRYPMHRRTRRLSFEICDYLRQQLDAMIDQLGRPAESAGLGSGWLFYFFTGLYNSDWDSLCNDDASDFDFQRCLTAKRRIG